MSGGWPPCRAGVSFSSVKSGLTFSRLIVTFGWAFSYSAVRALIELYSKLGVSPGPASFPYGCQTVMVTLPDPPCPAEGPLLPPPVHATAMRATVVASPSHHERLMATPR